jgi:hypothetical protein
MTMRPVGDAAVHVRFDPMQPSPQAASDLANLRRASHLHGGARRLSEASALTDRPSECKGQEITSSAKRVRLWFGATRPHG